MKENVTILFSDQGKMSQENPGGAAPPVPLRDIPIHPRAQDLFTGPYPSEQVRRR